MGSKLEESCNCKSVNIEKVPSNIDCERLRKL